MPGSSTLWRPAREDRLPLVVLFLLPLLVAAPQWLGFLHADPFLSVGGANLKYGSGYLPGDAFAYIDPNVGFTTQALGAFAARAWLHGVVPWWNSYTGLGMPLAGEYQPAAFSPLTLLLLLPHGIVWRHLALQVIAGWGCYALVRQWRLGRLAALTGGLMFAQSGALAWFADAPPASICFLPWVMLGVERAALQSATGHTGAVGWRLLGLSMGMMLLAGFPETAYICGLLALVFSLWRWTQCSSSDRFGMAWRVALGGSAGLALAAPQLFAFVAFLPHAYVGAHGSAFAHAALPPEAVLPSLLNPYIFGPVFAYANQWPVLSSIWGNIGGYTNLLVILLAAFGLAAWRDQLGWLLAGWILLALAKTFDLAPLSDWWNLIPGISQTAFYRFAPASWEFALTLLVCRGIEALARPEIARPGAALAAGGFTSVVAATSLIYLVNLWPQIAPFHELRVWAKAATASEVITVTVALAFLLLTKKTWRAQVLAILLAAEATILFAIPTLRVCPISHSVITELPKH